MGEHTATVRIEARFKNARLYNAIVADAIPILSTTPAGRAAQHRGPIKPWCDFHDFPFNQVYRLLSLRLKPLSSRTGIRPICLRIAALFGVDVLWLFPPDLYQIRWPTVAIEVPHERLFLSLSAAPLHILELPPTQEEGVAARELKAAFRTAMKTLTPREALVVRARFGFDADEPQTFDAIGNRLGVGGERIRQIEAKAMRKLRHPSRAKSLRAHLRD